MSELVALIDRFIDDKLSYALEWDDFISWTSDNAHIELIRQRIADTEVLFFSENAEDRQRALAMLMEERDRAAAFAGLAPRKKE